MTNKTKQQNKIPKLRFPGFSGEWEERILGEICEITSSKRIYLSDYVESGIPFFRGKEISELKNRKPITDLLYIKKEKFLELKNKFGVPVKNDILITSVGTLGNVYRIDFDYEFYFKDGNLIWLKNIKINSKFLEILLSYNRKKLLKSVIGTTQKALTIIGLKKIKINIPQKEEQQKIAGFLGGVDEWIENLKRQKEELEKYKKGIMQKIFSQEIRFKPARTAKLGGDNNGKNFPEWEEKRLGEVCQIEKGSQLNKNNLIDDEKYPVYSGGQMPSGHTNKYNTEKNTLIISEGGNSCGYINFIKENFWSGGHCYSLQNMSKKVDKYFLYQLLKFFENEIMRLRVGSGLPNVQKKDIKKFTINIPSLPEQQKIADFLGSIDEMIQLKQDQITKAQTWKKGLMQGLFV